MAAQDPREAFDLYDEHGAPLGRTKPRALVHRDGDWHRSMHLWVVLAGGPEPGARRGEPWIVLQRRSAAKDTWPRAIDVAVTGHLRAGESLDDALREADEEIGLSVAPADVVRLGTRFRVDDTRPGILDREIQDVLLTIAHAPLAALRPDPDELEAVLAVSLADAARLFADRAPVPVNALALAPGAAGLRSETIAPADLVVAMDGYYARAIESIRQELGGATISPFSLRG